MKKHIKKNTEIDFTKGKEFNNFKNFSFNPEIKQAALTAISVQVSSSEIKELQELFLSLDVNGDGSLSLEEIQKGMKGKANEQQIMAMLKAADTDGSGDINYTEFIAATIGANIYMNEAYLKQAFDMFDKDKSGKIDREEVIALLSGDDLSNIAVSRDQIEKAIKEID